MSHPLQRAIAQRFSALARYCRDAVLQQVGSYPGVTPAVALMHSGRLHVTRN
jgi:hypothetical protein